MFKDDPEYEDDDNEYPDKSVREFRGIREQRDSRNIMGKWQHWPALKKSDHKQRQDWRAKPSHAKGGREGDDVSKGAQKMHGHRSPEIPISMQDFGAPLVGKKSHPL